MMIWAKIDEFLMSAKPHGDFLKIIWDPGLDHVVSEIMLYRTVIYRGSSVFRLGKYWNFVGWVPFHGPCFM